MKLKKLKTLNEAIAEVSDTDQGVVGIVYADAIRETENKKKIIDRAFKDRKLEMPNEDRFAHEKVDATKEMKKMQLAESLFTEWVEDSNNQLVESFAQPNFAVSEDQYTLDDASGNITISKDIFSDYIKDGHVNILFVDEAEDGEDKVLEYKMIAEDDSNIVMEYVGVATPGIDEEIADCQKYPIEKPEAKDSQFVSADDKQPKNVVKAKDSRYVSAGDKQPEKAAMKESVTNYDERINRIKTIFANKDWSTIKKATEKSAAGKKEIKDYFNKNGLTDYADLLDKVTIYLTGDSSVIGYAKPADNSITLNRELDIRSAAEVVKHELDNLNKNGLKESFTNWDSPESRVERYFTDLPGMIITLQDHYDAGRIAADELAKALKVAYDALDSVPQIDEALEASQKYPIEKPEAKDSQFVSAGDKQPTTAIDAKDSQFISAGDKDVEKANKELVKESMLVEEDEETKEEGTFVYKNKREPLGDLIQVELTEGEWGYIKYPDGRLSPTRLPSANYLDTKIGADWDRNDKYAITVLGADTADLEKGIAIATKYGKEYRIEKLIRPIKDSTVRLWIYVDEEKDFDEPYFDPNVETVKGKSEEESLEASQKYPIKSPFEAKDSQFVSKEDKYPVESPIQESIEELDELEECGNQLTEIRITTEGLGNFKPYGEAAQTTWKRILDTSKISTFEFMLEDMYPNGIGSTQLNDLLAYNRDWIFDMLGIGESDSAEAEEETYPEIDDDFDM